LSNNNIFVTSHQTANVYTKPAAHYEVRCDDKSIDIQVDKTVGIWPSEMMSGEKQKMETKQEDEKTTIAVR